MPRKSRLLPYLRLNRTGRLTYYRRIPAEIRAKCGGLRVFSRSLGLTSVDPKEEAVITAWSAARAEAEELIIKGRAKKAMAIEASDVVTPLKPRDAAGIAAEPWRQLLEAQDNGAVPLEIQDQIAEAMLIAGKILTNAEASKGKDQVNAANRAGIVRSNS